MVCFPFSAGIEPEVVIIVSGLYCESAGKCLPGSLRHKCELLLTWGVILVTYRNHLLSVRNIVFVWMDLQSAGSGIFGTPLGRPRCFRWLADSWQQTRSIAVEKPCPFLVAQWFWAYEWQAVIECSGRIHHESVGVYLLLLDAYLYFAMVGETVLLRVIVPNSVKVGQRNASNTL